ncbi:MAG: hypothetical protein V7603_2926 [Micromonosporaceae bacterium]|jgi:hypothetical protein
MPESYPELIARLVAIQDALGREQAEVHAWYAEQRAAATEAVELASATVEQASRDVAEAQEAVARVDVAARRLWGDLGNRLSWRAAKRRGPVPGPVPDPAPRGDQADRLISQVRARLAAAPVVQVLAPWAYPLMALFGAGCAAALARLALALAAPAWLRIALLAAAPLLGLVPARLVARAQRSGLDTWSVTLTVLAGALATGALLLAR